MATLLAVTVWPAFGEEFLYRGTSTSLLGMVKKPVTAIVLTSILFAASHIPIYVLAASGEGFTNLLKRALQIHFVISMAM